MVNDTETAYLSDKKHVIFLQTRCLNMLDVSYWLGLLRNVYSILQYYRVRLCSVHSRESLTTVVFVSSSTQL